MINKEFKTKVRQETGSTSMDTVTRVRGLRNVVVIAACLAVCMISLGCEKEKPKPKDAVELTSPITENKTLKDLGLPIDYYFNGDVLEVKNNAILTIEDSVTIQFRSANGSLFVTDGATIKALGTAEKRIQFIGASNAKGSWHGVYVETMTDNQFVYCDFLNAGIDRVNCAALYLLHAKASITNCKFTNGSGYGLYVHNYAGDVQLTAFNNNVFENFDLPPVYIYNSNLKQLEKFDMTSDFTKNAKAYIELDSPEMDGNVTINQTTVPFYFDSSPLDINHTLTINEGVTIYMRGWFGGIPYADGRLMINGTAARKVKITRLPGETDNWDCIDGTWLAGSVIKHCILEYGGEFEIHGVIFAPGGTDLTLENVEFKNSKTYDGVIPYSTNCIIRHNNITYSRPTGNIWFHDDTLLDAFP